MTSQAGDTPGGPDLQCHREPPGRSEPGPDAVSLSVITEFEATQEAKRVDDLAGPEILGHIRAGGFDRSDLEWQKLAAALTEYGYAVLVAWGVTGTLAINAAKHAGMSRARVPKTLRLNEDEARALAGEVLLVAIEKFRTRSLPGWHPTGGASLKTFFIGRCLMELADAYEAWHRRERRSYVLDPRFVDDGRYGSRPDEAAEASVLADDLLEGEPVLRSAFEFKGAGYGLEEIAQRLGTTRNALRSRIYHFRQRIDLTGWRSEE